MDWTHAIAFAGGLVAHPAWYRLLAWMDRRDEQDNDKRFGD